MSRCPNCKIEILDKTESCPLCRSVLEQNEEMENMYPDAVHSTKRMVFISRLYVFGAIVAEIILVMIDLIRKSEIKWSILIGLLFLYIYTILRYAIIGKTGYRSKIIVLTFVTIMLAIAADFATGYRGWAVEYVISSAILLVDAGILALMFCNRRNWQSYIPWQIFMIFCSVIPLVLHLVGLKRNLNLAVTPLVLSALLFLGTFIIGGSRARTELKRRFHI